MIIGLPPRIIAWSFVSLFPNQHGDDVGTAVGRVVVHYNMVICHNVAILDWEAYQLKRIEANFEINRANFEKNFVHSKNFPNFVTKIKHGALAHLARAFDWQSRGDEFESRMLHNDKTAKVLRIIYMRNDF